MTHVIMKTGKSKICRVCQQARDPEKSQCCSSSQKAVCCRIPSCWEEVSLGRSMYYRSLADWMRPYHIMKGNLLYSKPTSLNVYPIRKPSQKHQDKYLITYLGTIAWTSWYIKLTITLVKYVNIIIRTLFWE